MINQLQLSEIQHSEFFTSDLAERFLRAAVQIAAFAQSWGVSVRPAMDKGLPLFRQLPFDQQVQAVRKIELSCSLYASVVRENQDLRDSSSLIWMGCRNFGLRPPSDFFDKLSKDDVIQVYSLDGVHQFSNMRFFEVVSYTLEQIYCYPWPLLWKREPQDTEFLEREAVKIMNPEQRQTIIPEPHSHYVVESSSPLKFETTYSLKCVSPLFDRETKEKKGFIVCEAVTLLSKYAPLDEERMLEEFEQQRGLSNVVQLRTLS